MKIDVLDHGYVELVEAWGIGSGKPVDNEDMRYASDRERGIIEAARQSTQGGFRGWNVADRKLLKFLYEHKHFTPFEFAGMVVEVQAPIFVFREWHRHRTQSYNEMSARYAPLPDLYYVPTLDRVMQAAGANKQAQGTGEQLTEFMAQEWIDALSAWAYRDAEAIYQRALKEGVPKELARITMPVGHYSRMRASASLRNWLQFLTLRTDPAAQWEIREYANAVGRLVENSFPHTWRLFRGDPE